MRKVFDRMTPRLRRAFLLAVNGVKGQVNMTALTEALTRGNLSMAMTAINTESLEEFLRGSRLKAGEVSFYDELLSGVSGGAAATMGTFPTAISSQMAFDMLNPNTVRFIENYRVPLIRELTETTRNGVFQIVKNSMVSGLAPIKQSRQIRQVIGLTEYQARAIDNFRAQLQSRKVMGLTRPDKRRLSAVERRIVARHMKQGGLSSTQIDSMTNRYYQSLLNRRSMNIARTEAVRSSNIGQLETWRQAKQKRLLSRDARKKWIVTPDERLRPTHRQIPGMNRGGRKLEEHFQTPEGAIMSPPQGTNCRCAMVLSAF